MKHLLKFEMDGGDADITYSGFVIFDDNLLEIYKDLIQNVPKERLKMDCDDLLPIDLGQNNEELDFSQEGITDEEFEMFVERFPRTHGWPDKEKIISFGHDEFWVSFFDSDYCHSKYGISSGTMKYSK